MRLSDVRWGSEMYGRDSTLRCVLYVAVEDAAWRHQMAMDTEKILKIIHACPNGRVVRSLRLVRGEKRTPTDAD